MSKAFTKEDVDPPERSGRVRSPSGLPPGAINYITPGGAASLRSELENLRRTGEETERIAELERILGSVAVVEPPAGSSHEIGLGARITLCDEATREVTYRILGVDELDRDSNAVSWISPVGRALLASKLGDRLGLEEIGSVRIVKVEYPVD